MVPSASSTVRPIAEPWTWSRNFMNNPSVLAIIPRRVARRPRRARAARIAIAALAVSLLADPARPDTLDAIRERGELVWGADAQGGAPFEFPDPDQPSRVIGFEVELAD